MFERNPELIVISSIVIIFLSLAFGMVFVSSEQKLRCIQTLKDKPALEINLVCKF